MQDDLVIAARTRYPSNAVQQAGPAPASDLDVARRLLSIDGQASSRHTSSTSSAPSSASLQRNTTTYVHMYNALACEHGLAELTALIEICQSEKQLESERPFSKPAKKHLWRKLVRSDTSTDLPDPKPLVRKDSISSLLRRSPKLSLRCQSLDDFYQLGGVSVLRLPPGYRAVHLAIPTCLAATANYLIENGRDTAGIFRIPGQTNIVHSIYHYYLSQIHEAEKTRDQVHINVGSATLPSDISPSIHDVASAFKKFLWDLPGGVLGSMSLFKVLQDIESHPECSAVQPRLCALAILSLMSARRIAVVCSVFGLLAYLKQDPSDSQGTPMTPSRLLTPESMSSKALSLVFAPVLLSGLTDQIETRCQAAGRATQENLEADTPRRTFWRTPKQRKSHGIDKIPEIAVSLERTNAAAALIEMLLRSWEDVATQMRTLDRGLGTQRSSHSKADLASRCTLLQSIFDGPHPDGKNHTKSSKGSGRRAPKVSSQPFLKIPRIKRETRSEDESDDAIVLPFTEDDGRFPALVSGAPNAGAGEDSETGEAHAHPPWWDRKVAGVLRGKPRLSKRPSVRRSPPKGVASRDDRMSLVAADQQSSSGPLHQESSQAPIDIDEKDRCIRAEDSSGLVLQSFSRAEHLAGSASSSAAQEANRPPSTVETSDTPVSVNLGHSQTPSTYNGSHLQLFSTDPSSRQPSSSVDEEGLDPGVQHSAAAGKGPSASSQSQWRYKTASTSDSAPGLYLHPDHAGRSYHSAKDESYRVSRLTSWSTVEQHINIHTPPSAPQCRDRVHRYGKQAQQVPSSAPVRYSPTMIPKPSHDFGRSRTSLMDVSPSHRASRHARAAPKASPRRRAAARGNESGHRTPMPKPRYASSQIDAGFSRSLQAPASAPPKSRRLVSAESDQPNGGIVAARRLEFRGSHQPTGLDVPSREGAEVGFWKQQQRDQQYMANVGTLYAEVRMLHETLAVVRRERDDWRTRALWAEDQLAGRRCGRPSGM